jgi:hypothetical protein
MHIVRNEELQMSKMSELSVLIQERLERGEDPVDIAYALDVPISWIFEEQKYKDETSPFATINS